MNRRLWEFVFNKKSVPAWPCPICNKGIYVLIPNSIDQRETIPSLRKHNTPSWGYDFFGEFAFNGWLKCSHCGQQAIVSGTGGVEPDFDEEKQEMDYMDYYLPLLCWPMPDIFTSPRRCPETVRNELRKGFALFWADEASAANRLRIALERLMDHFGVKKRTTLHNRIDLFSKREPSVGVQLMSLKWLGNTGSHEGKVQRYELLNAYEITEHVLNEVIDKQSAKISKLAKELTKKHGKKPKSS